MQSVDTSVLDQEKLEVEALLERFSRSPRIAGLLSYICRKYFAGELDQLNETQIAIEVFGRPPDFDRSQDAIARVEAHRLRRKLKEFYEGEGKDRPIQIVLPPGSYIPVFQHRNGSLKPSAVTPTAPLNGTSVEEPVKENENTEIAVEPIGSQSWHWRTLLLAFGIFGGGVAGLVAWHLASAGHKRNAATLPSTTETPAIVSPASPPIRILCGYSGAAHIGLLGNRWTEDQYYIGGRPEPSTQRFTGRTNDPFLFRRIRTGEFSYAIPLKPGTYELHLFFVEATYGEELGGGELSRTFLVRLNGRTLFDGFDIIADAMGPRIADERVIRDVSPDSDGKLHLSFESERGQPIISAIEVLPGIPHRQLPVRIVTQQTSFTDHLGQVWSPDNYFLGGQMSMRRPPVTGTLDSDLYASERVGNFTYAIPVDPRDTYTANLYFAETYFGPDGPGGGGIGSRVFNVSCNGVMLLQNFDIFREAGRCHALMKSFHGLKPNAQGKLLFWFDPVVNYASIFAIEVLDEAR
jgi:hypothetical protein